LTGECVDFPLAPVVEDLPVAVSNSRTAISSPQCEAHEKLRHASIARLRKTRPAWVTSASHWRCAPPAPAGTDAPHGEVELPGDLVGRHSG
jgi:hypothetical protein